MNAQFKKGALEICVLAVLERGDCYGYDLVTRISRHIDITEGTIYPLLRRLRDLEQVETYLAESPDGPPRKYYHITDAGKAARKESRGEWERFTVGMNAILQGRENMVSAQYEEGLNR